MKRKTATAAKRDNDVLVKCTKIEYDPEFARPGLKKSMKIRIDMDLAACALQPAADTTDGDPALDFDELAELVQEYIEDAAGCPVSAFKMS